MSKREITVTMRDAADNKYVPPPLGNGSLSLQIDFTGAQSSRKYCDMPLCVCKAGLRFDSFRYPLVDLGRFDQTVEGGGDVTDWTQTLDYDLGEMRCRTVYESGAVLETTILVHYETDLVVIRKKLTAPHHEKLKFAFQPRPHRRVRWSCNESRNSLLADVDGWNAPEVQEITLLGFHGSFSNDVSSLGMTMEGNEEALFAFAFDASAVRLWSGRWPDQVLDAHRAGWRRFWEEDSFVSPSDFPIRMECYWSCQYHLKISSTKWSVPTGIFQTHWNGRYFGYDELYVVNGLLASGHLDQARKIVEYRHSTLEYAENRASRNIWGRYFGAAHYSWEAIEDGSEGTCPGYWMDHIFHMSNIALSAWEYFSVSQDVDFLREKAYPVMKGCMEFFRLDNLYDVPGGGKIIGRCTDLERLGGHVMNPFLTSCSAIAGFEAASQAAKKLGVDADLAELWSESARGLRRTLPNDGKKYIPWEHYTEQNVCSFGGVFPYRVLSPDDPMQIAAAEDAWNRRTDYALQYTRGKTLSTWYASVIALAFFRLNRVDFARDVLIDASRHTGCFAEAFEVYEKGIKPYFTTAEGCFVQAVNEIFGGASVRH